MPEVGADQQLAQVAAGEPHPEGVEGLQHTCAGEPGGQQAASTRRRPERGHRDEQQACVAGGGHLVCPRPAQRGDETHVEGAEGRQGGSQQDPGSEADPRAGEQDSRQQGEQSLGDRALVTPTPGLDDEQREPDRRDKGCCQVGDVATAALPGTGLKHS